MIEKEGFCHVSRLILGGKGRAMRVWLSQLQCFFDMRCEDWRFLRMLLLSMVIRHLISSLIGRSKETDSLLILGGRNLVLSRHIVFGCGVRKGMILHRWSHVVHMTGSISLLRCRYRPSHLPPHSPCFERCFKSSFRMGYSMGLCYHVITIFLR